MARLGAHWVGVVRSKFCYCFLPPNCVCLGGPAMFFQVPPPLLLGVQKRGPLAGLVGCVGA